MAPMAMEIRCSSTTARDWSGDALVVGVFSGDAGQGVRDLLTERFGTALPQRLEQRRFQAKPGESASLELLNHAPAHLIVVGLGAPADFGAEQLRSAAAAAGRLAAAAGAQQLGLALPVEGLEPAAAAGAMAEALRLGLFADQRFKSDPEPRPQPQAVELLGLPAAALADCQGAVASSTALCSGVELARQLVAAPPNVATPAALADTAAELARSFQLELKVLERSDCEALGMGSYLAV